MADVIEARDAGIALLETADRFTNLLRLAQSPAGDALAQFLQVSDETLLLLLTDCFVLLNALLTPAQDVGLAFALNELNVDTGLFLG